MDIQIINTGREMKRENENEWKKNKKPIVLIDLNYSISSILSHGSIIFAHTHTLCVSLSFTLPLLVTMVWFQMVDFNAMKVMMWMLNGTYTNTINNRFDLIECDFRGPKIGTEFVQSRMCVIVWISSFQISFLRDIKIF